MIRWIRNPKFLEYHFKRIRTYIRRFSSVLVKGDQVILLNVNSLIHIISFCKRKLLLSVNSFQKGNFVYHDFLEKNKIFNANLDHELVAFNSCWSLSFFDFLRPELTPWGYMNRRFLVPLCCLIVRRPNLEVGGQKIC